MTLLENVTRITSAIANIKAAIIRKGVTPTGKCETFADAIDNIPSGVDVSNDTLYRDDELVLGITAHNRTGKQITGALPLTKTICFQSSIRSGTNLQTIISIDGGRSGIERVICEFMSDNTYSLPTNLFPIFWDDKVNMARNKRSFYRVNQNTQVQYFDAGNTTQGAPSDIVKDETDGWLFKFNNISTVRYVKLTVIYNLNNQTIIDPPEY